MAAGMSRTDAERAARIEMGSLEALKDHVRDVGWSRASRRCCRTCATRFAWCAARPALPSS
jgi:hypothetical protein